MEHSESVVPVTAPVVSEPDLSLPVAPLNFMTEEQVAAEVTRRIQKNPEHRTDLLTGQARFNGAVQELARDFAARYRAAKAWIQRQDTERRGRLAETEGRARTLQAEFDRLDEEIRDLGEQVNDQAAEAGLALRPDQRTPDGIRNSVRVLLGVGPAVIVDGEATELARRRATREETRRAHDAAIEAARTRAETEQRQVEEDEQEATSREAQDRQALEKAEEEGRKALEQAEQQRITALVAANKRGLSLAMFSILEWLVVAVLAIFPGAVLGVAFGTSFGLLKHGDIGKVRLLQPETFLNGAFALPFMIGFGITMALAIAMHFLTMKGANEPSGSRMTRVLIGIGVLSWLAEVFMEVMAFHEIHIKAVANANAIRHTVDANPLWYSIPLGFVAGTPFLLAKVGAALYKETQKKKQEERIEQAKAEALAEANAVRDRLIQAIERERVERQAAFDREQQRLSSIRQAEAQTQERLATAFREAERDFREAEREETQRREKQERAVSDFIRECREAREALKLAGRLMEKQEDQQRITVDLNPLRLEIAKLREPVVLSPVMLGELVTARSRALSEYESVMAQLGILVPTEPEPARDPTPVLTHTETIIPESSGDRHRDGRDPDIDLSGAAPFDLGRREDAPGAS